MKRGIKLLPDSILKAFRRFTLILTVAIVIYLIFQFNGYLESKNWLDTNKQITYIESNTNVFFENLLAIENTLLKYLKEVPIFSLGYVKEFHPYKAEIKNRTKENYELIDLLIDKIKSNGIYKQFSDMKLLSKDLAVEVVELLYKKKSIQELKKRYKQIEEKIYILKSMTSRIQEDHIIKRGKNIDMLSKNMYSNLIFLILLIVVVFFILYFVYQFNRVIRKKINYLTSHISSISDLENIEEVDYQYKDEIKPVINVFNEMIGKIKITTTELIKTRNYMNNIFNSSPALLISTDENGLLTNVNNTVYAYLKNSERNYIGVPFWKLHPFFEKYKSSYKEVLTSHEQLRFSKQLFFDETKLYMDVTIYPLITENQRGVVIMAEDVTKIELLDQKLRQSQKMELVGNLAGGLAHDFNNVLGGIVGTVSLLKYAIAHSKNLDIEKISKYADTLDNASERAGNMVNQLLTLSRKSELSLSKVDLNIPLNNIEKICKNSFSKTVKLNFVYYKNKAYVSADPTQIEQFLLNLCVNAEHAMTIMRNPGEKRGGILTVTIDKIFADASFCSTHKNAKEQPYWVISTQDNGIGMDPKLKDKIFDPFFSTKGAGKGTGLGLSMVYNIVEQHDGFIEVYSEPGIGTTFNVYLPEFIGEIESEPDEKANDELMMGSGLILVIDDEQIMRELARNILEKCGYRVICAEEGVTGIEQFIQHRSEIVAVLLDFAMPNMTGREVFIELKKLSADIKILLTSGFSQDDRVKEILNMGANGFIKKPFSLIKLSKAIHRILNGE